MADAHDLRNAVGTLLLSAQRLARLSEALPEDPRLRIALVAGRVERAAQAIGAIANRLPDARAPAGERRSFSVAVFCRNAGAVLLVRHRRLGTWLPVGGEIEAGETPLEAARRELREETGLSGRFAGGPGVDGTPPGLIGYEEHPAGAKGLHMNFAFVADVDSRRLVACDEWDGARWVTGEELGAVECPLNVRQLAAIALGEARPR